MEVKLSAKVRLLKENKKGVIDDNRCLDQQIVVVNVYREHCKDRESANKKAVTEAELELENMKEAVLALEEWASPDKSLK